jgi:hypothetical protein
MPSDQNDFFATFQRKGVWWLPDAPDKLVHGTLTHTEHNTTLELAGALREVDIQKLGRVEEPPPTPVIYGHTEKVGRCTLFRNQESVMSMPLGGQPTSSVWQSRMLFVGAHIPDPATVEFSEWSVAFTGLEEWMGVSPFPTREFTPEGQRPLKATIRYVQPEIISVSVASLGAKLEFDYDLGITGSLYRSLELEHTASVVLRPDGPKRLEWYFSTLRDVQNFLLFCSGEPLYPKRVEARVLNEERAVRVYYHDPHRREQEALSPHQMPMPLPHIRHMLSEMVNNWFTRGEKLRDVYGLFFSTVYNTELYAQSVFLSLTQALETYSRAVHEARYLAPDEYEKVAAALVAAIPSDAPADLKASLKSRIRFGNEHSLRNRLKGIVNSLEEETLKLICNDPQRFVNRVVDTRNYLTHYSDELREKAIKGAELQIANYRMQLLLTILLCKELGVFEWSVRDMLKDNPKWVQLIHLHLANGA